MPNVVTVAVENPDQILNAGGFGAGAVIRVQTSATEAGVFADVAGAGSTPTIAIVDPVRVYTGYDPAGIASSWYRTRFENAGGTRLSDWSTAFQVGDEQAGYVCSLYDVKQRLSILATDTTSDETLLEFMGAVTGMFQGHTGRRFVRAPLSGETTYLFDVDRATRTLWIPKGIASASLLEVANQTGGPYSVVPAGDWFLDPPVQDRNIGWPATRITLSNIPTGAFPLFYPGKRVVRVTMALGFAASPPEISNMGAAAVVRMFRAKQSPGSGADLVVGSPEFGTRVLASLSPGERARLDWYAVVPI